MQANINNTARSLLLIFTWGRKGWLAAVAAAVATAVIIFVVFVVVNEPKGAIYSCCSCIDDKIAKGVTHSGQCGFCFVCGGETCCVRAAPCMLLKVVVLIACFIDGGDGEW